MKSQRIGGKEIEGKLEKLIKKHGNSDYGEGHIDYFTLIIIA